MPRGFDQPTSSSASRTTDTGSREQPAQSSTTRTRQGRYGISATVQPTGESKQLQSPRKPTDPRPSDISHPAGGPPTSGTSRKPPAYLQGKNPYGQVLANIEHPYREPDATGRKSVGPPQIGTDVPGTLRGSGAVPDGARPTSFKPERTSIASNPQPPEFPSRQAPKSVSVQAAKNFFESKASQSGSAPPLPPASAAIIASSEILRNPQSSVRSRDHLARPLSPTKARVLKRRTSDSSLRPSSPHRTEQAKTSQPAGTAKPVKAGKSHPDVIVRRATTISANPPFEDEQAEADDEYVGATGHRRSTNIFVSVPRDVALSSEQNYANDPGTPAIRDHSHRSEPRQSSEETVKRHHAGRSPSIGDLEALGETREPGTPRQPRRSRIVHDSSCAVGEGDVLSSQRLRRQSSRSAPLADMNITNDQNVRNSRRRCSKSSATDTSAYQPDAGRSSDVRAKVEAIAARGLSHDGSGSVYSLSQHSTDSGPTPTADVAVQDDYDTIEVPDHVDSRGAYGRRKTQDFGYPGARIKPRRTVRLYNPPQDPSNWVKRICGHFSYMSKGEVPELATKKRCQQCSVISSSSAKPQQTQSRRNSKQAATDSSNSISSSLKPLGSSTARTPRRRRHHSECIQSDKCADTFAKDLGLIIDSILEEHASTLQGVINNIKHSQPSLIQLRRVSQDLVQRSQATGICTNPRHTACRPQCTQQAACQQICEPVGKPQTCEWMPPCPYVPPKAVEKLNVGSPGQIVPNVNDSRASLHESVNSVPELVNLVNSAADDLGLDLDRRPTAKDDELFQDAPYEKTPRASVSSQHAYPLEDIEQRLTEEDRPSEDPWLQQTRRHLTELSEARTQLMDELDSIADDLGVQLEDRHASESEVDHVQRVLSKVKTGISRRSTRLRNKSVDSVAEEIPKMIDQHLDERRLSRVLTRISTQSRRMSAITQNMQEIGEIPPEEIQEWLVVAQTELPAAIDSITTVLETLPALDFESADELEEQPQYEERYEPRYYTDPQQQYELFEHEPYEDYAESPPRRAYTEPINELQNRIADLERRLRRETSRTASPEIEQDDFVTPLERKFSSTGTKNWPTVHTMVAEDVIEDAGYSPIQSAVTRRLTLSSSRRSTFREQSNSEESVHAERFDREETENLLQPETPPIIEHGSDRRTSTIKSAQPHMQPERTFSFVSQDPNEVGQPINDVPQELANMGFDIAVRQPTRRRTSVIASPVRNATFRAATPPISSSPEMEFSHRKPSRIASMPSRKPTIELDLPWQEDRDEPVSIIDEMEEEEEFEVPVENIRRSMTSTNVDTRLESVHSLLVNSPRKASVPSRKPTIEPDLPWREDSDEPVSIIDEEANFELPVERVNSSTTSTNVHPQVEPDESLSIMTSVQSRAPTETFGLAGSSRRNTRRATGNLSLPETDSEIPLMNMTSSIAQPNRKTTIPEAESESDPPRLIAARSLARESRRPTLRSPSLREEPVEELPLLRATTRQPTRQMTRKSTAELVIETPEEDFEAPVMWVRRTTTQPPPPSPEIEAEIVTRRGTAFIPPFTGVTTRMLTRQQSESLEDPPAPPSSPSTEAEMLLPSRVDTTRERQPDVMHEVKPPVPATRATGIVSRAQSMAPKSLPRRTDSTPRQPAARQSFVQTDQLTPFESSLSNPSEGSLSPVTEMIPQAEDSGFSGQMVRRPTTVYEPPFEETNPQPVLSSHKSSFRPSPSMTGLIASPTRQSTIAARRTTFEDALNVSSRRATIMSDPTTIDIPPRLATRVITLSPSTLERVGTEQVSRRPTRKTTEPESTPLPISRQSTMHNLEAPSRRTTASDMFELGQRNVEEPEVELYSTISRHPTRRLAQGNTIPLPISRESTVPRPPSLSRHSSTYSLSEPSLQDGDNLADEHQPTLSRQLTRQPTSVGRKPTRKPTEPVVVEPGLITRQTTRQKTMPQDLDILETPVTTSRQTTVAGVPTRQSTLIQIDQRASSEGEVALSSSSNSFETQPMSSRAPSVRERQMTTTDRSATLLQGPSRINTRRESTATTQQPLPRNATKLSTYVESVSAHSELESEPEEPVSRTKSIRRVNTLRTALPSEPENPVASEPQPVSRRSTIAKAPTSIAFESPRQTLTQETQLDEPGGFEEALVSSGSESDPAHEVEPSTIRRLPTQHSEMSRPNIPSRKSTWSTEAAVLEEKLPPTALSRKTTALSRHPTRQPTRRLTVGSQLPTISGRVPSPDVGESLVEESPAEESPAPATRKASRQPTQISRKSTVRDDLPTEVPSRQPTQSSRTTTFRVGSPSKLTTVGTLAETSSESKIDSDARVTESSRAFVDEDRVKVTRNPTRVPTKRPTYIEDDQEASVRLESTRTSRQPTRVPIASTQYPVQSALDSDSEIEKTPELDSEEHPIRSSSLGDPLAAYDVYRGALVQSPDHLSDEPLPAVRRTTTVHRPVADYPPSPPPTPPRQQTITSSHPEQRSIIAVEEIPEEEPGRVDRAPTADLSRDPESFAHSLARKEVETPVTEPPRTDRQRIRIDPQVDERVPRVLTVPRERDRRRSSAAPGIVAPAPEGLPSPIKPTPPAHKSKRVANYPPEHQYPPAPAYPHRETPSWTRPDTQTSPPKPRAEDQPRKRRFLGIRPKATGKPVQRPPEPHPDRESVEPFRHAAPGPVPGPPGGTLQRPRGYPNRPANKIYHRTPAPIPVRRDDHSARIPIRRDDHPAREAPIYARKDDYYPRLKPIIRDHRNNQPRPQPVPIRRDVQPQYSQAQAPARRDYPAPAPRDHPTPNYGPPRRHYPQAQSGATSYRNNPRQQPLRRQTPEPIRRQHRQQQVSGDQERAAPRSKAASSQRRPQDHQEPSFTQTSPQEEDFNGTARRDARGGTSEDEVVAGKEATKTRDRQTPTAEKELSQFPQQEEQQLEGRATREKAQRTIASRRSSKISGVPVQNPQTQAPEQEEPEQKRQSPIRGNEPSSPNTTAKASSQKVYGNDNFAQSSQEGKTPVSDSVDEANGSPSLEIQWRPSTAGTGVPRESAQSISTTSRRASTQSQTNRRRSSTTNSEQEKSLPRALTRHTTARRASEAGKHLQTARKDSSPGTRRPSTALATSREQRRSSNTDASTQGRSPPSRTIPLRTTTAPSRTSTVNDSTRKTADRRSSATTAAPISRAADSRAEGARSSNSKPRQSATNSPAAKSGSGSQKNERTGDELAKSTRQSKKAALPHHPSAGSDKSESNDPILWPRARIGDKNSFGGQRAPAPAKRTPSSLGRGKGQAESGGTQSGGQGAIADHGQQAGKGEAKTVQGVPSKGRWGWGWGKG
ncbi:hypothetical protein IAQ61_008416 [Plenodomus lingam]|uniref:Predicted protein n=1 Tax=Leptosphaeria maculans (strain JN3 / isolate v23.1.3 / race Av1-4-5-6-7-8) TaxID=985895 RepID=E4ZU96_LEPMJ|nr:predicted protein [Plenodomus lingam JN3]KAH9866411.1 hypothetical protein IAQ61_008416 [Plenodomus lingam]CBX94975.1 predicted protein [Plenodomus lingam JN3]